MKLRQLLLATAALGLTACGYGVPSEVTNGVIVYSQPAANADFGPISTYYLNPQMSVKKDGADQASQPLNATVAAAINTAMQGYGYTSVATEATADVELQVSAVVNSQSYYYSGGWCNPYYGYYGCYYPPVYAGTYTYGTVAVSMADLRPQTPPVAPGGQIPVLWFTAAYGIAPNYPAWSPSKVATGITRGFEQSPYLLTSAP